MACLDQCLQRRVWDIKTAESNMNIDRRSKARVGVVVNRYVKLDGEEELDMTK